MLHVLKETLGKLQLPRQTEKKLLTAADLGCSCGQNTLLVADLIVQGMAELCGGSRLGHRPPEFCFYFNDLPSNDFKTLFHLLPDSAAAARNGGRPAYFAAGVAGSFYDRLFPERCAAYRRQFQSDLARFLRCRAAELERGGAMFLVCLGRPSSAAPVDQGTVRFLFGDMFQDSWHDLVHSEKVDSFNVPVYAPTLEEFREVVDADGSFQINRLELVMGSPPVVDHPGDAIDVSRTVANNERSLLGALVDAQVGKALCDELFLRLQRRAEERAQELMEEMRFPHVVCSLSLA
nr:unnamed protein product [Digitaria exilis]